MLRRHIGFGAVRGHSNRGDAQVERALELLDGTDTGQEQRRQLRPMHHRCGGLDPLPVGVATGTVGEAVARKTVAVSDLDGIDSGAVEGTRDAGDVLWCDAVPHRVHTVAQRHILDVQGSAISGVRACRTGRCSMGRVVHRAASNIVFSAIFSATCSAAEVMMSRLPAYAGR